MRLHEGRGYVVRAGLDAPWAGTLDSRALAGLSPSRAAAPWMALRQLGELSRLLPGGLHLVWDDAPSWYGDLDLDAAQGFWEAIGALPNLSLHLAELPDALQFAAFRPWLHCQEPPTGLEGERWRNGALGWVKRSRKGWSLPGFGHLADTHGSLLSGDDLAPAFLWGEITIPLPALASVDAAEVAATVNDLQAAQERSLAQRLGLQAWPAAFPFQRRRAQWRLAFLGGAEFMLSGGTWEEAADLAKGFSETLASSLKSQLRIGACDDTGTALRLGRQAMGEGLPWRSALPLPPDAPTFTPGFGADSRRPSPLEARGFLPPAFQAWLDAPPVALLRVPAPPSAAAVESLLTNLGEPPAIRWLPPEVPDPGPYIPENTWAAAGEFPYPADPAAGVQLALFDDLEA